MVQPSISSTPYPASGKRDSLPLLEKITYNYNKFLDNYYKCSKYALICIKIPEIPQGRMMAPKNSVKKLREQKMISKAELARLAGVSAVTIDRIERGEDCRMETKRKLIIALGFSLSEKNSVFSD
jgi:DNA-binding XRE family transcriptional regulator